MTEIRPGNDCALAHTAGVDFPATAAHVLRLRRLHTRVERGVTIISGVDGGGQLVWFLTATDPATGNLSAAWCYDLRAVAKYVILFSEGANA